MRIALIAGIFFPHPGGAQVQIHNLANKLQEQKINVDCYLFEKSNLKNNNYKIIFLNKIILSFVFLFKYYLNLELNFILKLYIKNIIKNKKYDIWHFNFINFKSLILINCLNQLNQKILVTFQGVDIQINEEIKYGYRINKKYDKYLRNVIHRVDHFSCLSETVKEDILNLGVQEEKLSLIPNAVELNKFEDLKKINQKNKKKLKLITVARFAEKKKGYDLLPLLASKLIDSKIDFKWIIIGKNTKNLKKINIIKNNANNFFVFDDIINFTETYLPNSELIKKYIESDLYVNLSRIESFGITFVEALASGIPVVSFDTKGVNEIIKDNYNGYIIKGEKIDLLHKKIKEISLDSSLIKNLQEGIKNSTNEYDLNLVTNKFLNIYEFLNNK